MRIWYKVTVNHHPSIRWEERQACITGRSICSVYAQQLTGRTRGQPRSHLLRPETNTTGVTATRRPVRKEVPARARGVAPPPGRAGGAAPWGPGGQGVSVHRLPTAAAAGPRRASPGGGLAPSRPEAPSPPKAQRTGSQGAAQWRGLHARP